MSCNHTSQVRRAACAGDDDAEAARCSIPREFSRRVRGSMCGENTRLARHPEFIKCFDGMTHGLPIRFAAHDDSNQWLQFWHEEILECLVRLRQQTHTADLLSISLRCRRLHHMNAKIASVSC